jgi:hypothetical protein
MALGQTPRNNKMMRIAIMVVIAVAVYVVIF